MFREPMRLVVVALFALVVLIQYPLWLGKGGWFEVRELQRRVEAQRDLNAGLQLRNAALDAEVRDLQTGTAAIEERGRMELGLVMPDEVFVRVIEP